MLLLRYDFYLISICTVDLLMVNISLLACLLSAVGVLRIKLQADAILHYGDLSGQKVDYLS